MVIRNSRLASLGIAAVIVPVFASTMACHASTDALRLTFDGGEVGSQVGAVSVEGTVGGTATVVGLDGARLTFSPGSEEQGAAVQFPHRDSGNPVAVIAVTQSGAKDRLSPGTRDFVFGADVKVDAGADVDGDNVLQRGLADDVGQYKLEIDGGHFACVVKGASGQVYVRSSEDVVAGVWYRAQCERRGDLVRLTAVRLDTGEVLTADERGSTGLVRTAQTQTPLSIGGKLTPNGKIATWQPDQLNGSIDNVFVRFS